MMSSFPRSARMFMIGLLTATACGLSPGPGALAKAKKAQPAAEQPSDDSDANAAKGKATKTDKKHKKTETRSSDSGKTLKLGTFGEWGAYQTQGKAKTCYALAKPKSREPKSVKRDPAYIFISTRPTENVKNEISVIMGFPMKDGRSRARRSDRRPSALLAKGANAWVKNPAEEEPFHRRDEKGLETRGQSGFQQGQDHDRHLCAHGLGQALDKVHKECP